MDPELRKAFDMATTKVTALGFLFLLQCHWIQCQIYGGCGYGGYGYPPMAYNNDNDLDILLPILLIALCKNGGIGGGCDSFTCGGCGGCGRCGGCGGCGGCGRCSGCGGCGGGCCSY